MNDGKPSDIRARLRNLRKVAASAHFEMLLQQRLRALHLPGHPFSWIAHPVAIALIATGIALVIAAYFFISSSLAPSEMPLEQRSRLNLRESKLPLHRSAPDSLPVDTASHLENDVNTSKLP